MPQTIHEAPYKVDCIFVGFDVTDQLLIRYFCIRQILGENGSTVRKVQGNIDAIKKNIETLIDASKEIGLEVNAENTKCVLLSHRQNAG
jgi:hypothetical protein